MSPFGAWVSPFGSLRIPWVSPFGALSALRLWGHREQAPASEILGHPQLLSMHFNEVANLQLFPATRFGLAVDADLTGLNQQLGLTPGADQAVSFEEIVEPDHSGRVSPRLAVAAGSFFISHESANLKHGDQGCMVAEVSSTRGDFPVPVPVLIGPIEAPANGEVCSHRDGIEREITAVWIVFEQRF